MNRRILASAFKTGGAVLLLFLLLFANDRWRLLPNFLGTVSKEIFAVLQDAETQRLVFLCLGMYYVILLSLQIRPEITHCAGRSNQLLCLLRRNASTICLAFTLLMGATLYLTHHSASASALVLMAGAVIGQGIRLWTNSHRQRGKDEIKRNPILWSLLCLILLLTVASVWHSDLGYSYAYRGLNRWTGPWDNPNIYGLFMGTGTLLAIGIGLMVFRFRPFNQIPKATGNRKLWNYLCVFICLIAVALMLHGLLHSYSRGAWLATMCGTGYLTWHEIKSGGSLIQGLLDSSLGLWVKRNWRWMGIIFISMVMLVFWQFRQTHWHPARRVLSVTRSEDFSWRNRLAAWEGALQIMADHPWGGVGWNQPKPLYQNYYLPPKEIEGTAIEMNDYLMLGATLGIPALLAFGLFLWLSFTGQAEFGKAGEVEASMKEWLQATCHAGAIVLLVGFWFDGGLFKLPTAVVFWVLMLMGAAPRIQNETESDQRTNGSMIAFIRKKSGFIFVTIMLLLIGALFWAKEQDPFSRKSFRLETKEQSSIQCIAVLPKPVRRLPVIIYAHGWSENLAKDGNELRQMAELGMAAVSLEYNQANPSAFASEMKSLLSYIERQSWADTNEMAWVGFSLGANRMLDFVAGNPERQPQLLVQISGAGLPEAPTNHFEGIIHCPVLLIHGEKDDVFPIADTERLLSVLQSNAVPVKLSVLPAIGHGLEPERNLVFRNVGEYCLKHLLGSDSPRNCPSKKQRWDDRCSLWLYFLPAVAWSIGWVGWRWRRIREPSIRQPRLKLNNVEIALRWLAAALAIFALTETVLHLVTPQFAISDRTISIARRYLVQSKNLADFDYLARQPFWQGQKLGTLLDNVRLAGYNRELINWPLDDQVYRDYVLSPAIGLSTNDSKTIIGLNWRRPLWEEFYPRIRHESSPESAARTVVRHLRERVTIADLPDVPHSVPEIWLRRVTDEKGFQIIYVAALRAVGVAARLNGLGQVELYANGGWKSAPQSAITAF